MDPATDTYPLCPTRDELRAYHRRRREQSLTAMARAYVLTDIMAHTHPRSVLEFIETRQWFPMSCGAPRAAIARLRQGALDIDGRLGVWTGDFLLGLKLSGAFAEKEPGHYRIAARAHEALVQDIERWPIAGHLGAEDRWGRRRIVACRAIAHLPPKDPAGASVLAGLFAGAVATECDGETWLTLPHGQSAMDVFERWTIRWEPATTNRGEEAVRVSPFYAALFAHLMPPAAAARVLGVRQPALCPLLPALHWELAMAGRVYERHPPFAGALPWLCSKRTFHRRKWTRRDLHRRAVLEVGLTGVDGRLKKLMVRWYEQQRQARDAKAAGQPQSS